MEIHPIVEFVLEQIGSVFAALKDNILLLLLAAVVGHWFAIRRTKKANARQQILDHIADQRALIARIADLAPFKEKSFSFEELEKIHDDLCDLFPKQLAAATYAALSDALHGTRNGSIGPRMLLSELRKYTRHFAESELGKVKLPPWENSGGFKTTPG